MLCCEHVGLSGHFCITHLSVPLDCFFHRKLRETLFEPTLHQFCGYDERAPQPYHYDIVVLFCYQSVKALHSRCS